MQCLAVSGFKKMRTKLMNHNSQSESKDEQKDFCENVVQVPSQGPDQFRNELYLRMVLKTRFLSSELFSSYT